MTGPVSFERQGDIAIIRIANPPVNALSLAVRAGLLAALDEAAKSDAVAIILTGAGRGFSGGADISEFGAPLGAPDLNVVIAACESHSKPIVALIHGMALGGGLELALGCAYRLATDDAQLGLPEVKLGIFPGAGGTQRLPRLVGAQRAIALITSGEPISAKTAAELGIVDRITAAGEPLQAALDFARSIADQPVIAVRDRTERLRNTKADELTQIRATIAQSSRNLLAPLKAVDAVTAACTLPFDEGLIEERRLFEECLASPQSKSLIHVFFAERAVWKIPDVPADIATRPIAKAAIIGAGTMGGGIAMSFANAGISTTVIDADSTSLERGMKRVRQNYESSVSKGRLAQEAMDKRMGLLRPTTELEAIGDADIIIEAVFEQLDLKLEIFRKLDRLAKPGAILATNTSMLDVNRIAAETARPHDVVGLHFFSPANVMRLLEVVRGAKTAKDVLATVMGLARTIKKIPVVVGVCDGFVGNRMIEPYFREAEFLVAEGATPAEVDRALTDYGLAMGPFAMSDLAGVDVRALVAERRATVRPEGERYSDLVGLLARQGRYGQKSGAGFYRYEPGQRAPIPDPSLDTIFLAEAKRQGVSRRQIQPDEIIKRCLYALVNEGADILAEGIASRSGDIDVIYVNGYGFPAYRGGPMFAAELIGLDNILADIEGFRDRFGTHWRPSPLLSDLVARGATFSDPGGR